MRLRCQTFHELKFILIKNYYSAALYGKSRSTKKDLRFQRVKLLYIFQTFVAHRTPIGTCCVYFSPKMNHLIMTRNNEVTSLLCLHLYSSQSVYLASTA